MVCPDRLVYPGQPAYPDRLARLDRLVYPGQPAYPDKLARLDSPGRLAYLADPALPVVLPEYLHLPDLLYNHSSPSGSESLLHE